MPQVIVYVDQNGNPVSTTTEMPVTLATKPKAAATPQPAANPPAVGVEAKVVASESPAATAAAPESPAATAAASESPAASAVESVQNSATSSGPAPSSTGTTSSGDGNGVTYSPYNSDGTCKDSQQVLTDFNGLGGAYSVVRTYGLDCNTLPNVLAAAKAHGMKVFQGIYDLTNIDSSVQTIVSAVGGDWSSINTISIGNELVNSGQASASDVVAAVTKTRSLLRSAGYTGPVVTCDTLVATLANPSLCDNSDYCAVNSHPFFDPNTDAAEAGTFLTNQISDLKSKLANSNQNIVITETGWPSQGDTNGMAIPSSDDQSIAIAAIKSAFQSNPSGVVLFNPYNMHWKVSGAGQFNAEPWWGFLGECPSG